MATPSTSSTRTARTFCRICTKFCGLVLEIDGGRVVNSMGDREHPITRGFSCPKGRAVGRLHDASERFTTAQRRNVAGNLEAVDPEHAIAEIAQRLNGIVAEHGPDSIGLFMGTQAYQATPTIPFVKAWLRAVGTHKFFKTATIDQSAKTVTAGRMGVWMGGPQRFEDSDVWLFSGINPLVSMFPLGGFPVHGGRTALSEARERGLQLLVIDPRLTETAVAADVHLQLKPGTDALLSASLLHVILTERLYDEAFCHDHVVNVDKLARAVASADPESVAQDVGVAAAEIYDVARRFGRAKRGMAVTGTGANMGPWSNLNEHLVQALNAVCGRYAREGDSAKGNAVLAPPGRPRAHACGPTRPWESGYQSRFGYGLIDGDLPTASLPREITESGADRVRALIVIGGNPASAIPDQREAVRALSQLELLVTVDPFPTETAQLAHYVIAPAMLLERADNTRAYDDTYIEPFAMYTPPVLDPPPGVIEDWQFFALLARAMTMKLTIGSLVIEPGDELPTTDALLDHLSRRGRVDPEELRTYPMGHIFTEIEAPVVAPADGTGARLDVMPPDVARELAEALRRERIPQLSRGDALLTVRRSLRVMNTFGRWAKEFDKHRYNPCHMNPEHMSWLGAEDGSLVAIESEHGRIHAIIESDPTVLPGTISMSHCWGSLPGSDDEPSSYGSNPGRLLSLVHGTEEINAMPQMTAVSVKITLLPQ